MFPASRQVELNKARKFVALLADGDPDCDDLKALELWRSYCAYHGREPFTAQLPLVIEDGICVNCYQPGAIGTNCPRCPGFYFVDNSSSVVDDHDPSP